MSHPAENGLIAIDVGSSRVKLGWFPPPQAAESHSPASPAIPAPAATWTIEHRQVAATALRAEIKDWLETLPSAAARYRMASVCPAVAGQVEQLLGHRLHVLTATDLSLAVRCQPAREVGIDRLLSAVTANRLRRPQRPALTVCLGTAITVNCLAADGGFEGGAILAGLGLSAHALHTGTATLPELQLSALQTPPPPVGKSTTAALQAGLYWGAVGAIRQLAELQTEGQPEMPQVFLTGGDARWIVDALTQHGLSVTYLPQMILSGIAIADQELS